MIDIFNMIGENMLKKLRLLFIFCIVALSMPLAVLNSCSTTSDIAHPFRGTNAAGGDLVYGQQNWSSPVINQDYLFISNQDIDYLASKKIGFIRLLFSWEAMQPALNGPLANNSYANDMASRVAYATSKGINVMIEPHGGADTNFARYKGNLVGTTAVPNSAFADFWTRMANLYKGNPRVIYGLMNEPHDMSTMQWFNAAQAAITGIRSTGSTQMIFVPGNGWTGASNWLDPNVDTATTKVANSTAFLGLKDPANNLVVSVHLYLDPNGGGSTTDVASATVGVERMTSIVNWAKANGVRLHLSEIGASSTNPLAATAIKNLFDYIQANNTTVIGWSWWAYGPPSWWGGFRFTLCPTNNYTVDNVKMSWLAPYLIQPAPVSTDAGSVDAGILDTGILDAGIVDASPPPVSSTKPANPIHFTKNTVFTTNSGQTNWVYVPDSYDSTHNTPTRLFVWLHGCGGQSKYDISMVSNMPNQSWISLAPGGRETTCWSSVSTDGPKILAAIADLKTHFNIDPYRVVLGGYSSGGDIGYPLLFQNANMFAGGLFENTGPSSAAMTDSAAAAWKINIMHLAHTGDTTYPIAGIRTKMTTLKNAGFPVTLIEKPGTHWDNDNGTTGTQYDLRTFLLPQLNGNWVAPGAPPPPACVYTYSPWGTCDPSGTQTRTVTGSSPTPCTPSTQTLTQSCIYMPPTVDSGAVDSGTTNPFYGRRYVYNQGATWTCMYFYVKNTSSTPKSWSIMYVNAYDSKLTSWWSLYTNQVVGSAGSIKFRPKDVITINGNSEAKVGGACFDYGPLNKAPTVSAVY